MKTTTKQRTGMVQVAFALIACLLMLMQNVTAYALEDNLNANQNRGSSIIGEGTITEDDMAIGNWISQQRGMTAENLANASQTLGPLTNIFGNIVGGIVVLVFAGVFIITALDLLYISFPPIRNILYKGGPAGGMTAQPAMGGGMMGGYGHRGMMGGGMMAGAMAMQQQASGANMSMKSVIGMYFKKRLIFMILLAVCAIVLTSSVLLGTGVNLAEWFLKIMNSVNSNIPS